MQMVHPKTDRIHGIDFLRVVLSFCVVTIHVLFYGGFKTHADFSNPGFYVLWLLGIAIVCTVNCFALISGFVLYGQRLKYTSILRLLLTVMYHGLFITAAFWVFFPDAVGDSNWIQALLPVSQYEFWYFTSYFGVFFLAPVLIRGMESLPKKQATVLVVSLVVIFSVLPTVTGGDPFDLKLGYSVLWILVLFVIGTFLRKYWDTFKIAKPVLLWTFAGCILVTCLGMFASVLNPSINGMVLVEYTSPTIVIAAIAVVLLFASMQVPALVRKVSDYCVPFTFSIYLLHEHPLVRQYIIQDRFVSVLSLPVAFQVLAVLAITLGIWLICFVLEWIRQWIFRLLGVEKFLRRLEERFLEWCNDSP